MSERITEADLEAFESGHDYRLAHCSRCGTTRMVDVTRHSFACNCPALEPPLDVARSGNPGPRQITTNPVGPTLRERVATEVRRLRGLIVAAHPARIDGIVSDDAVLRRALAEEALKAEAEAIRREREHA
jgi:hypothetical protein